MKTPKEKAKEYSYDYIHKWIRVTYGKADRCENENCSSKSNNYEYAMINNSLLEKNRENFKMLCCSCHRKYDFTEEVRLNMIKANKNKGGHNKGKDSRLIKTCCICNKEYKTYKKTSVTCSFTCAGFYREKQKRYGQ